MNRIVVLDSGSISQLGSPQDLYENPGNLFVAKFIGSPRMNVFSFQSVKNLFAIGDKFNGEFDSISYVGIRAEHISISEPGKGHTEATIDIIEYLGADIFIVASTKELEDIRVRFVGSKNFDIGAKISLKFDLSRLHFFNENGKRVSEVL